MTAVRSVSDTTRRERRIVELASSKNRGTPELTSLTSQRTPNEVGTSARIASR
jgi:hypothetical protein